VLFLILIAVALFAALSYAVTSSSRSGGGDASSETNLISSANITQYPATVRTTIIRMLIKGTTVDELAFNNPSTFDDVGSAVENRVVFHPNGGGGVYSPAPADVMADGAPGDWYFNGNFEIPDIGISGSDGNELIAFLPGIKQGICKRINEQLGIGALIPNIASDLSGSGGYDESHLFDADTDTTLTPAFPTSSDETDIADASNSFDGEPFGCFQNNGGDYVYYHVLVER